MAVTLVNDKAKNVYTLKVDNGVGKGGLIDVQANSYIEAVKIAENTGYIVQHK